MFSHNYVFYLEATMHNKKGHLYLVESLIYKISGLHQGEKGRGVLFAIQGRTYL